MKRSERVIIKKVIEIKKEMGEIVVDDRIKRVIKLLGEKYNFDVSEGIEYIVKLGERRPRCVLPFCNIVEEAWCKNIKYNHGLMTQCTNDIEVEEWCKSCAKEIKRDGRCKYGQITERIDNINWKTSNGKSPTPYYKVFEKLNIDKEEIIQEAHNLGWTLPKETFTKPEKTKRGRPRKDKRVVTAAPNIDLIATLVTEAQTQAENQAQKDAVATPKKNKRGRPRKSQMTEMQTEKAKKMKKENKKMEKEKKENKKKENKKKENKMENTEENTEEKKMEEKTEEKKTEEKKMEEKTEEEENEELCIDVEKFVHKNKTYLKSADNVLFDVETHEPVGQWNVKNELVEEYTEEEY